MSIPQIAVIGSAAVLLFGGGVLVGRRTVAPPIVQPIAPAVEIHNQPSSAPPVVPA